MHSIFVARTSALLNAFAISHSIYSCKAQNLTANRILPETEKIVGRSFAVPQKHYADIFRENMLFI